MAELTACGVRRALISPGARSAPLTLAAAAAPGLETSVHLDERSAAFVALGASKASGRPVALICTSGTAAANYLPAVVEAYHDGVPLLVLTADRPPELRDTGAWQAIDQVRLYGGYVRWFADVAPPGALPGEDGLRYVRSIAARAVAEAMTRPSGPVHLNLPFREPLVAPGVPGAQPSSEPGLSGGAEPSAAERFGAGNRPSAVPHTRAPGARRTLDEEQLEDLADMLASAPRGVILAGRRQPPVVGDARSTRYAESVARLAAAAGYPVLAEPPGGLRFGPHDRSHVVDAYDAILRDGDWLAAHEPQVVLRIGASFAWRHVADLASGSPHVHQVVVDENMSWDDPRRHGGTRLHVDPTRLCEALADRVEAGSAAGRASTDTAGALPRSGSDRTDKWLSEWLAVADTARRIRAEHVSAADEATVGWVYEALPELAPDGALLYAANSMAVRDLDTFTDASASVLGVLTNRGAAGIDGTVSSAIGAALASRRPTILVTGDLAFAHDVGGLASADLPGLDLAVVVLSDGGGGIFEHTALAQLPRQQFERLFVTPARLGVSAACLAYGVSHSVVEDRAALRAELRGGPEARVIEIAIDRAANTALREGYWKAVRESLA